MTKEEFQRRVGETIATLRKRENMTQGELAERSGLTQNHITRIENGRYNVGFYQIQSIMTALGYDIKFVKH